MNDILEDAYVAGRDSGDSDQSLVYDCCRRISREWKRAARHDAQLRETLCNESSADQLVADVSQRDHIWQFLEELLATLPSRQRLAIEGQLDGIPDAILAQRVECSPSTVRTLRSRALKNLRREAYRMPESTIRNLLELINAAESRSMVEFVDD